MHCSRMLRLCAIPTALLLLTGVARGQVPATPDTTFGLPGNEPLDLSTPLPDESKHKTVRPFEHAARLRLEQRGRHRLSQALVSGGGLPAGRADRRLCSRSIERRGFAHGCL